MNRKLRAGIIGATGYVGQRFVSLLADHPMFEISIMAASARSAGKSYAEAVEGRWKTDSVLPEKVKQMQVADTADLEDVCAAADFVFCAVDMKKDEIRALEENIARLETPVVSNNSAHRWTDDVPVIIPEINPEHIRLIAAQRRRLGTNNGFIVAKPNCSIQSYVPALAPLLDYGLEQINVCTYQAISGAGKTFADWPEMERNLIPYIGGEEEKSELEPLKIWGRLEENRIVRSAKPLISSQCIRVGVQEGHTAAVSVKFANKPPRQVILDRWASYRGLPQLAGLPSAPDPFLIYHEDDMRPQPRLDVMAGRGMAVSIGRLRDDPIMDYKFICLSHNTLRGAAGGSVLTAELLLHQGYLQAKQ
jgi:aspartate-semialdehyde dehydrogenase